MKKKNTIKARKVSAGSRIIASLQEAADWVEGKDIAVRASTVDVPTVDVRETRRHLGLSQAAFAAKFGFQPLYGTGSRDELGPMVLSGFCLR